MCTWAPRRANVPLFTLISLLTCITLHTLITRLILTPLTRLHQVYSAALNWAVSSVVFSNSGVSAQNALENWVSILFTVFVFYVWVSVVQRGVARFFEHRDLQKKHDSYREKHAPSLPSTSGNSRPLSITLDEHISGPVYALFLISHVCVLETRVPVLPR